MSKYWVVTFRAKEVPGHPGLASFDPADARDIVIFEDLDREQADRLTGYFTRGRYSGSPWQWVLGPLDAFADTVYGTPRSHNLDLWKEMANR